MAKYRLQCPRCCELNQMLSVCNVCKCWNSMLSADFFYSTGSGDALCGWHEWSDWAQWDYPMALLNPIFQGKQKHVFSLSENGSFLKMVLYPKTKTYLILASSLRCKRRLHPASQIKQLFSEAFIKQQKPS